jgi:hypothetical protein
MEEPRLGGQRRITPHRGRLGLFGLYSPGGKIVEMIVDDGPLIYGPLI